MGDAQRYIAIELHVVGMIGLLKAQAKFELYTSRSINCLSREERTMDQTNSDHDSSLPDLISMYDGEATDHVPNRLSFRARSADH